MWVIFPIISSFFYGIADHIDNHLVDTVVQKKKAASFGFLRIPSYVLSIVLLLAIFGRAIFMFPLQSAIGIMAAGAINVIGQMLLFGALQAGDTVDIKIFSQASPLISLGLGAMVLGEKINAGQSMGLILIIVGALIVALFTDEKRKVPDFRVAGVTLIYSLFSILSDIMLVYFLSDAGTANYVLFGQTFFYFQLGCLIFTSFLVLCIPAWRKAIARGFVHHKKSTLNLTLAFGESLCFGVADAFMKFALISVPVVAMLTSVARASALFVSLFTTFVLAKLFPKVIRVKKMSKQAIARYALAAIFITCGILVMI